MKTKIIEGNTCYLYDQKFEQNSPIIYIGMQKDSKALAEEIKNILMKNAKDRHYLLVFYEIIDWDAGFSPWKAELNNGKRIFTGEGMRTIQWLAQCINEIESQYKLSSKYNHHFAAGYSLAGLFSIWALYESEFFKGAASCSGSFWYPGWEEYILKRLPPLQSRIYLSLGKKEEKTNNSVMSQVGNRTRLQYEQIRKDSSILSILEWHNGGHFHQISWRMARGIEWLILHAEKN